jgi:hypothetical protein
MMVANSHSNIAGDLYKSRKDKDREAMLESRGQMISSPDQSPGAVPTALSGKAVRTNRSTQIGLQSLKARLDHRELEFLGKVGTDPGAHLDVTRKTVHKGVQFSSSNLGNRHPAGFVKPNLAAGRENTMNNTVDIGEVACRARYTLTGARRVLDNELAEALSTGTSGQGFDGHNTASPDLFAQPSHRAGSRRPAGTAPSQHLSEHSSFSQLHSLTNTSLQSVSYRNWSPVRSPTRSPTRSPSQSPTRSRSGSPAQHYETRNSSATRRASKSDTAYLVASAFEKVVSVVTELKNEFSMFESSGGGYHNRHNVSEKSGAPSRRMREAEREKFIGRIIPVVFRLCELYGEIGRLNGIKDVCYFLIGDTLLITVWL